MFYPFLCTCGRALISPGGSFYRYLRPMQQLFVLLALLHLSSPLRAQNDFLRSLAVEVCSCLNDGGNDLSGTSALGCLETVALRHEKTLRKRYDLLAASAGQRDLLSALLVDDLLEVCPVLLTVRPAEEQREFRWADGRPDRKPPAPSFSAPKGPPADSLATITSEPPAVWRASGELITQPGRKGLRLRTAGGEEMKFDLPFGVARKRDFDAGEVVSLSYRREWRLAEGRIVLVVLGID